MVCDGQVISHTQKERMNGKYVTLDLQCLIQSALARSLFLFIGCAYRELCEWGMGVLCLEDACLVHAPAFALSLCIWCLVCSSAFTIAVWTLNKRAERVPSKHWLATREWP